MSGLELVNVTFRIETVPLVENVTMRLHPGSLTVLVGPNGSGKTTLLRLAAGLVKPTQGKVELNGTPLPRYHRRELARQLAFVPQDTSCAFAFTVRELVAMGRNPHLGRFSRESAHDREVIAAALKTADIEKLADRRVTELSGGERQRAMIARSLATESEVLLLDEPTASLDIAHALDVLDLCQALVAQGKTLCVALHDLNMAVRVANHVVLMHEGRVFDQGAPGTTLSPTAIEAVFGVRVVTSDRFPAGTPYVFERIEH
ncbi:MAG: ABC transporter ATP-binding protein [Blastocatellia bacterium]|nr:ABC transporter ATP-binding protein [Blastocatellia bacterium]